MQKKKKYDRANTMKTRILLVPIVYKINNVRAKRAARFVLGIFAAQNIKPIQ